MEIAAHIDTLDAEGRALLAAAERAGLDAPVPTCPGWQVDDLLEHAGGVHGWAAAIVRHASPEPVPLQEPPTDGLFGWYGDQHAAVVAALRAAPTDLDCWTFLSAPSPLAFWARRQAHETAMHRVDAESAAGGPLPDFPATFAADGIDELVGGFIARSRGRLVADPERSMLIVTADVPARSGPAAWHLTIGPDYRQVRHVDPADAAAEDANCRVHGPASALYMLLWNRRTTAELSAELTIDGDPEVLTLWREKAMIKWA